MSLHVSRTLNGFGAGRPQAGAPGGIPDNGPMSEPRSKARTIEKVAPGILNWLLHDDRIDYRSDAHAVVLRGKTVLIDPLPLTSAALGRLGKVEAICLTGSWHQRAAWTY